MRIHALLFTVSLLAGCSSPSNDANAPVTDTQPAPAPAMQAAPPSTTPVASASGEVKAVDVTAKTVTIAHGPVGALNWPAMTMTFKAPNTDLSTIKQGDQVDFEFTSAGMDGTITAITRK
jgi:Cu(I)/Ag(I) efflux system periplasmic protein CusF